MLYENFFSTFQVYGALRMSVKMFLMWNSKMLIDGGGDVTVATSLLEASNLVVLRVIFLSNYFIVVFWTMLFRMDLYIISIAGIVCHTLECKSGSSWPRFIELIRTRRFD